jgi:hypothetical protein
MHKGTAPELVLRDWGHLNTRSTSVIFKYSVLTSKKTQSITITKISCMLYKEIIVVYADNNIKPINTHYG